MDRTPFWRAKTLEQMTPQEWESLCDGCGRCCLHKLRDDDTGEIAFTNVACHLLDGQSCRCRDYPGRQRRVPDCIALSPADLAEIDWLPPSCGYRLVAERRDLPAWHPLVSGDPDTVHTAGASVRGRVVSERRAGALEDYVVNWPGRMPRRPRRGPATVVRRQGVAPPAGGAGPPLPQAVPPAPGPEAATLLRVVSPVPPPARTPSSPPPPIEAPQNPAPRVPVSQVPVSQALAAGVGGTPPRWAGAGPGPQIPSGKETET